MAVMIATTSLKRSSIIGVLIAIAPKLRGHVMPFGIASAKFAHLQQASRHLKRPLAMFIARALQLMGRKAA